MSLYWYNFRDLHPPQDREVYPGLDTWLSIYKACPLVMNDRMGYFKPPISIRIDPQTAFPDVTKRVPDSFEECCLARALSIFEKAQNENKPIYLLFSGGLDSTTVAISFLRTCPQTELRERLKIVTSTDAWIENPRFVRDHLVGKFEFLSSRYFGHFFDGRALIVNGDLSEFGALAAQRIPERPLVGSHKDIIFEYLLASGIRQSHAARWAEVLEADRQRCPVELPTLRDWLWWIRFGWTWQSNLFNTLGIMTTIGNHIETLGEFHERVYPFFGTEAFQLWMMIRNADRSPAKNMHRAFIREYTHDDEWAAVKQKYHSFTSIMVRRKRIVAIDDTFHAYHDHARILEHYDPNNDFI